MTTLDTGIYKIENLRNGRIYIGSAVRLKKRWRDHNRQLETGTHHSRFMQRCYNKHGAEVFDFSVLLYCDRENLIDYEQRAIDTFKPEYNSSPTAGSQLGYTHTAETRKKMSASRPKGFSPMTGKKHTEETKKKISESRKGKGNCGWTQERRDNISKALKGREITEDQRKKISRTLMGHKQSPEQIEKRMKKLRGRKMPEGFAEAARVRATGRKVSEETLERMSRSRATLTEDQVISIRLRRLNGEKQKSIAESMGISISTVADISCGRKYRWVKL